MADLYPIRSITAQEYAGFRRVHDHAFNGGPASPARWARALRQFEPERSLAAFGAALPAGEEIVGTNGACRLTMTMARTAGGAETRGMPVTKITLSTAMRARDVSRPHDEHLAEAAEREDAVTRLPEAPAPAPKPTEPPAPTAHPGPPVPAPPAPRRRRRRRS